MGFGFKKLPENSQIENEILCRNINNMFYLCVYMIFSECVMLISFVGIKDKLPAAYQHIYLGMYIFLLVFALCFAIALYQRKKQFVFEEKERKHWNWYTMGFVFVVMLWGVIIALLDQPVYGQLIAFVINYVFCACLLLIKPRNFVCVEAIPLIILFFLLPFFQKNSSVLLGHYINLVALLVPLTISSFRSYIFFYDNTANKIEEKAHSEKDELTNLYNRRKMNTFIEEEIKNEQKNIDSLGILMLDVDYFKNYNDSYGHQQGDEALLTIGTLLKEIAEKYAIFVARYGGEEFIIIIKNKNLEQVSAIAREIKERIDQLQLPHRSSEISAMLTVSIGQHFSEARDSDIYSLIKKADDALYEAKMRGRNQIASI